MSFMQAMDAAQRTYQDLGAFLSQRIPNELGCFSKWSEMSAMGRSTMHTMKP
jgi:hypothetical protein